MFKLYWYIVLLYYIHRVSFTLFVTVYSFVSSLATFTVEIDRFVRHSTRTIVLYLLRIRLQSLLFRSNKKNKKIRRKTGSLLEDQRKVRIIIVSLYSLHHTLLNHAHTHTLYRSFVKRIRARAHEI